jgi:hypothetical protein
VTLKQHNFRSASAFNDINPAPPATSGHIETVTTTADSKAELGFVPRIELLDTPKDCAGVI